MTAVSASSRRILREMIVAGASTRGQLCQRLGLSKASVGRAVGELLTADCIAEGVRFNDSSRGRRTTRLSVRRDLVFALGADLEGLALRTCVLDATGQVVASGHRTVDAKWSTARMFREWTSLIERVKRRSGVPAGKIVGLGAGLPGMVSEAGRRVRAYLPPGRWIEHDVRGDLERFALPVTAANNAVCVAEYERRLGAARGAGGFISILARYGIGAALYSDGAFLIGEGSFTGELGHMRVAVRGPKCVCGSRGCLDVYVSGRTLPGGETDGSLSRSELRGRIGYLAIGIGNLLKVFHPPLVVLNGIYNAYADKIGPDLATAIEAELSPLGLAAPRVVFADHNELKASVGAAQRAMDAFLESHLAQGGITAGD